jgi:RimJ/RimL family protein N-acetyltransferase
VSLGEAMRDGELMLEPLAEAHREPLRAACAEDPEIWAIYPMCFFGEHFDPAFDKCLRPGSFGFAVLLADDLLGMSSYLDVEPKHGSVQIGRTYFVPRVRGTGINGRVKRLMLDRAFASGFHRAEFKVDTRNSRSMAAIEKIGAVREGTLRKNLVTWTGYQRDTAVYSILTEEWARLRGEPRPPEECSKEVM